MEHDTGLLLDTGPEQGIGPRFALPNRKPNILFHSKITINDHILVEIRQMLTGGKVENVPETVPADGRSNGSSVLNDNKIRETNPDSISLVFKQLCS